MLGTVWIEQDIYGSSKECELHPNITKSMASPLSHTLTLLILLHNVLYVDTEQAFR